jgi:short-subunit dehydrogenase
MAARDSMGIAMITGASSGIGAEFARQLAAAGYDLVLVARRRERLERLQKQLSADHEVSVEVLVADLADPAQRRRVEHAASEKPLSMLVNNAGVGGIVPFDEMPASDIERIMAVNVVALTCLTRATLPGMLSRRKGTIINVGSGLSFTTMANAAVYAGSKAYVVQFTQALNDEVGAKGIRLQALIPGLVRTELGPPSFYEQFPPESVMSPETLVAASLAGLELGELVCIPLLANADDWAIANAAVREIGDRVSIANPAVPAARYARSR